jgi:hypothetical protein
MELEQRTKESRVYTMNRVGNGNDDISSEEHFENLKKNQGRGTFLLLELYIFVQIYEFYLVIQSFK